MILKPTQVKDCFSCYFLFFIALKLLRSYQYFEWFSASFETMAEKLSHLETQRLYKLFTGF